MTPQRIKEEAEKAAEAEAKRLRESNHPDYGRMVSQIHGYESGYIAGATAENTRTRGLVDALITETEKVHKMYHEQYGDNRAANHLINTIRDNVAKWKGEGEQ